MNRRSTLTALALATLLATLQASAQQPGQPDDAYRDLLTLPEIPEDAVERQVQEELEAADERVAEVLAVLNRDAGATGGGLAVTLDEAVARALEADPALQAVEEVRREVEAGVAEVKADAYPQLAAVGSYGISRNPSFLNSPDFEDFLDQFPGGDFEPAEQELYSVGVSVSQPVYTFGKLGAAIDLARLVVDTTEAQITAARMDTALDAAIAYYDVLARREALVVVLVQRQVRREALEVVRARYEIGEATRLELLRAQSAVAEVTPAVAEAAGDLEVAESELASLLALPPGAEVAVRGASPYAPSVEEALASLGRQPEAEASDDPRTREAGRNAVPPPPADTLPPAPADVALWSAARLNRPEIADLELQREVLAKRQQVTRAEGRPQIEFNGFLGREARLYENLAEPLYDNYSVSLNLSWEFFDGGRRRGQIEQFESQRRQLAHRLDDLLDMIELDLARAGADYRAAVERYRAARTAVTAAREASRVARESYREGVALQTDWLDAQRQETEAEIRAVDAWYDARRAAARMARAVGAYPSETDLSARLVEDARMGTVDVPAPASGADPDSETESDTEGDTEGDAEGDEEMNP